MGRHSPIRLVCATAAVGVGLLVAGCGMHGRATVNPDDAAAFRSSSAAEADPQAKATATNCQPFLDTVAGMVGKYNDFINAHSGNAPDQDARRDEAAAALDETARGVENRMNVNGNALPPELGQRFVEFAAAAHSLADQVRKIISSATPVAGLNDSSQRLQDAVNGVRSSCPPR